MECLTMTRYYHVLQISPYASTKEVREAADKMTLLWNFTKHPSKEEAEETFQEISEAYKVLSDDTKRQQYNMYNKYIKFATKSCPPHEIIHDTDIMYENGLDKICVEYFFKCNPFMDFYRRSDDGIEFWIEGLPTRGPFKIRNKSIIESHEEYSTYHSMTLVTVGEPHCLLRVFSGREIFNGDEIITRRVVINSVETVIIFKNGFKDSQKVNYISKSAT